MDVYPIHLLEENWRSKFKEFSLVSFHVETVEGLVLLVASDLYGFMDVCHNALSKQEHQRIVAWIKTSPFLRNSDGIAYAYCELMEMTSEELWKKLGNHYYDVDKYSKAYYYYDKLLKIDHQNDKVLSNMGLIYLHFGQIDDGLKLIERAYTISRNESIYLQVLKVKTMFGYLEDEEELHRVEQGIVDFDDNNLSFLIWYYDRMGKYESSATSFLRLKEMRIRWIHVGSYMRYMLESKQMKAMEVILKPMKDQNSALYKIRVIETFMDLGQFEEALDFIDSYSHEAFTNFIYILESICYTKCGSIIQGVKSMNQVDPTRLKTNEMNIYYRQMAHLASFSNEISKEDEFYHRLIKTWKAKYRDLWLTLKYKKTGR